MQSGRTLVFTFGWYITFSLYVLLGLANVALVVDGLD